MFLLSESNARPLTTASARAIAPRVFGGISTPPPQPGRPGRPLPSVIWSLVPPAPSVRSPQFVSHGHPQSEVKGESPEIRNL